MYKLLIDSSFKLLIVALAKDEKVIDRIVYDAWQRQSELLIPEIDNIMKGKKASMPFPGTFSPTQKLSTVLFAVLWRLYHIGTTD